MPIRTIRKGNLSILASIVFLSVLFYLAYSQIIPTLPRTLHFSPRLKSALERNHNLVPTKLHRNQLNDDLMTTPQRNEARTRCDNARRHCRKLFLKIKKSTMVKASRLLITDGQEHHIFQVFVQPLSNKGTTNPKLWETKIQSYHFSAVVFSTFTRHVY